MNGLAYILFVTDTPQKEIALELHVSSQMLTKWLKGLKPIAEKHLPVLSSYFGIPVMYFQKELTLQDKIEIEMQLASRSKTYENIDYQAATLHKQNEEMKKNYMTLLNELNTYVETSHSLQNQFAAFHRNMVKLAQEEVFEEDPYLSEHLFESLKDLQKIRQLLSSLT